MSNKGGGDTKSHIKTIRMQRGLTQVQVAQRSCISVRCYQRIEAGENQPKIHTAQKIASTLNVTVDELFPVYGDAKTEDQECSFPVNSF